jgi:hypothetical protein
MRNEPDRDRETAYARAIAERDEAIRKCDEAVEERDVMLSLLRDLGAALCKGQPLDPRPTADGVEVCELYPTRADALAAMQQIRRLRVMCLASDQNWRRSTRRSKPLGRAHDASPDRLTLARRVFPCRRPHRVRSLRPGGQ